MKKLNASEFRGQCLALLDNLPAEGVLIMKRGKPVARLSPLAKKAVDNNWMFGCLKGKVKIQGDILSTGVPWDAES